jgi:hypothetical protein
MNLKRLTVNEVKKKYWDKVKKVGKPVRYYSTQTYGEIYLQRDMKSVDWEIFVPDGSLHHINAITKKKKVIEDWLSMNVPGPYKKIDSSKGGLSDFYYLGGILHGEKGCLQICSNPLNVVSEDCMDEVHLWIKK